MADDSDQIGQDEIEQLLRNAQDASGSANPPAAEQQPPTPADDAAVDQAEIEALLSGASPMPSPSYPAAPASAPSAAAREVDVSQDDIELLLNKAEAALASVDQPESRSDNATPPGIRSFEFQKFAGTAANADSATLELMRDVQLDMTIELGRTHMHLEDVLRLKQGSVVPLDKLAGDPADILVNGRLVARGEVLVLNDNFCVRVAELIVGESACA
ncbi:MAG: flagellar motor switch protein FliN [Planctomycetales bacterium]|nr:flagellar motor switch protein FliN [Planctomycetales bacterium]